MTELYLTAYDGAFLGPIARLLGWIMDKIYLFLADVCHIENIGLAIVIFTILVYACLFPLTYKQQKFSMLQRKMQPELNAVRNKYKGKTDQAAQMAMNEETQRIYDKYGVSPMGSCIQLIIQMPILFALYRVFYNVPAYITSVRDIFTGLVNGIVATDGYWSNIQDIVETQKLNLNILGYTFNNIDPSSASTDTMKNYVVDVLYKLSESGWNSLSDYFPNLSDSIASTAENLRQVNYLGVLNISDTPWNLMKSAFDAGAWIIIICAILIPVGSYLTQVISMKLVMSFNGNGKNSAKSNDQQDQMMRQMNTMNKFMPIVSFIMCFTVPVGLGFYWIMSAVVRIVQQIGLNKHFEHIDLEQIIEKNKEKAKKKQEKRGIRQEQIYEAAKMNTRSNSMASKASISQEKTDALNKAEEARAHAKSGSLASKANLVKDFNERNNK